jgi:RNA recognition motif-containing protein
MKSKGFGFVEMPSEAEAQSAIDGLNGKDLGGNMIKVNEARPKVNYRGGRGAKGSGHRGGGRF